MFGNKKTDATAVSTDTETFELPSVVTAMVEKTRVELKDAPSPTKITPGAEPSVLSAGAVFKGTLTSPGAVHAQGKLEGELTSPHVTLGGSGEMSGRLKCRNLVIDGKFDGELECDEAVAGAAAVMDGILICKSLQVAPGAQISGKVEIGTR
jgi:cytoskeletal protein CcmA (bactofilin family)